MTSAVVIHEEDAEILLGIVFNEFLWFLWVQYSLINL